MLRLSVQMFMFSYLGLDFDLFQKCDINIFVYLLICFLITGGMDPRCKICIFMGKTDPDAPKHKQQVMVDNG